MIKVGEKIKMNYLQYENYLQHHGVKGMKWGVRKNRQTTQLKQTYKKDAKDARNAYKAYVKSMPKILGFRDAGLADKNAKRAYEKANAKANDSRYNYELVKSKNKGKATKQLVKISGKREYDRIYDELSNTNMNQDKIHEKAKNGQLKVEELLKTQKF